MWIQPQRGLPPSFQKACSWQGSLFHGSWDVMMTVSLRREGSPEYEYYEYFYEASIMKHFWDRKMEGAFALTSTAPLRVLANITCERTSIKSGQHRPTKFHQDHDQINVLRERETDLQISPHLSILESVNLV